MLKFCCMLRLKLLAAFGSTAFFCRRDMGVSVMVPVDLELLLVDNADGEVCSDSVQHNDFSNSSLDSDSAFNMLNLAAPGCSFASSCSGFCGA